MSNLSNSLPTQYQQFIHLSRYSRWLPEEGRRETWGETVGRYFNFFESHLEEMCGYKLDSKTKNEFIKKTLDRRQVWMAQTPQTFHKHKLLKAYNENTGVNATDESMLMELSGFSIKIINGDDRNFKITKEKDWGLAEIIARENKL